MPAAVRRLLTGLVLAAVAATAAAAQTAPTPAPDPDPAITFTGRIGAAGSEPRARLALSDLEKLPQRTFTTHTPWAPVAQTFSGPLLRDVLID